VVSLAGDYALLNVCSIAVNTKAEEEEEQTDEKAMR